MNRAIGQADRTRTLCSTETRRRRGFVSSIRPSIAEAARRVSQDVVAVPRKPVGVPVPLVGEVTIITGGLPFVLVIPKAMEHDDQRVPGARVLCRIGKVDIHRSPVETR